MNTQEAIQILKKQFQSQDWFSDVEQDQFNNIVVYVKYLSSEVIKTVPDKVEGYSVLTHFAASKKADSKQFITDASTWQPPKKPATEGFSEAVAYLRSEPFTTAVDATKFIRDFPKVKGSDEAIQKAHDLLFSKQSEFFKEPDTDHLSKELDRLGSICGDNILQEIFYEVHDGKNALTNFSTKYPEVRKGMERLYSEYGFETINEEWE